MTNERAIHNHPGEFDPTKQAERLRECMAEMSRLNGELSSPEAEAYRQMAHEGARLALQAEREANGIESDDDD